MINWFQGDPSIEDGYYWRKDINSTLFPIIVEITFGNIVDVVVNSGGITTIAPNHNLQDYMFSGPLECPE